MAIRPSSPHSTRRSLRTEAFRLRDAIRAGLSDGIARARAVFRDLAGIPDAEVADRMGAARCEHVVAVEQGARSWAAIPEDDAWSSLWHPGPQPHLFIAGLDGGNLDAVVARLAEAESANSRLPLRSIIIHDKAGQLDPATWCSRHPAGRILPAPTWINPCVGMPADSSRVAWDILAGLAASGGQPLDGDVRAHLQKLVAAAIHHAIDDRPYRSDDDLRRANNEGWVIEATKSFLCEPLAAEAEQRMVSGLPGSQVRVRLATVLHRRDGGGYPDVASVLTDLGPGARDWMRAHDLVLIDGDTAFPAALRGPVLLAPYRRRDDPHRHEVRQHLAVAFGESRVVIDCATSADLQACLAAGVEIGAAAATERDADRIFAVAWGRIQVAREISLDDILASIGEQGLRGDVTALDLHHRLQRWQSTWPFGRCLTRPRLVVDGAPVSGRVDVVDLAAADDDLTDATRPHLGSTILHHLLVHSRGEERRMSERMLVVLDGDIAREDGESRMTEHFLRLARKAGIAVVLIPPAGTEPSRFIGRRLLGPATVRANADPLVAGCVLGADEVLDLGTGRTDAVRSLPDLRCLRPLIDPAAARR